MLLLASGILLFSGFSFAQDANLLAGLAGPSSTISYYGPYFDAGKEYWVAYVEPENSTYVLSRSELVRDQETIGKVLETHDTYALALKKGNVWDYFAAPAMLAFRAEDVFLGLMQRGVAPLVFGTEKLLVGSVSGLFLPPNVSNAAFATVAATEKAFKTELGLVREETGIYAAGWEARVALGNVKKAKSYEAAAGYGKSSQVVLDRAQHFVGERSSRERTHGLFGSVTDLSDALYDGGLPAGMFFGNLSAAKESLGVGASERVTAYANGFCELPWCEKIARTEQ